MELMLAGCSAGSLGVQVWSASILSRLSYSRAGLIADSFLGVFPGDTEGVLVKDYGFCEFLRWNGVTPKYLVDDCDNGKLRVADIVSTYQGEYPDVLWSYLQSKEGSFAFPERPTTPRRHVHV